MGGLFIPLDEHMEVYCNTPDYSQCLQYSMHPKPHPVTNGSVCKINKNRRNSERLKVRYTITLVRLLQSERVVSHFSTHATTLDLSNGGMRLTTSKPLSNDTIVHFSFGDSFPQSFKECTGHVEWCNKEIDSPDYQAGISFHDSHLIEAMGLYLGLQHRQM